MGQGMSVGPGRFGKKYKRRAGKIWKKEYPWGRKIWKNYVKTCVGKKSYYKEITMFQKSE